MATIIAHHLMKFEPNKLVEKLALAIENNERLADYLVEDVSIPKLTNEQIFEKIKQNAARHNKEVVSVDYDSVRIRLDSSFNFTLDAECTYKAYFKNEDDMKGRGWDNRYEPTDEYAVEGLYTSTEYISL